MKNILLVIPISNSKNTGHINYSQALSQKIKPLIFNIKSIKHHSVIVDIFKKFKTVILDQKTKT